MTYLGQDMLEAFSLRRNIRSLLDTETPRHDIPSLHGIRALNAVGLLLSHKQMALLFLPFVNRTTIAQVCCVVPELNLKQKIILWLQNRGFTKCQSTLF